MVVLARGTCCNYNKRVRIECDPAKSAKNQAERGLPFSRTAEFDWETALYREDTRMEYPERRYVALGFLEDRIHVVCFTAIPGGVRAISFRKANAKEMRRYAQEAVGR